jgi:hypothetical protein
MSLHQRNAEDAALIRFHTNGAGGTGTETFTSALRPEFENVRSSVHDEVINDIRQGYYAGWVDRGKKYRGPYEEPPNFLFELAFHDRAYPDNTFLKDPKFRQLCARAIFQGFVKYFANKDGRPVHLSPEPPRSFMVRNTPAGIQLKWEPPETDAVGLVGDGATSYVVYLSSDGKAWDNGRETVDTGYTFTGLTPDTVYYFRVAAINEGGESFPTKTLSARVSPTGGALILIVDGYDRLDRYYLVRLDDMPTLGTIYSMELSKMNMFDNIIRHARAMENNAAYFDSADKMAVVNGLVQLDDYALVDWLMGRQGERVTDDNAVDFTFNDPLRNDVQNFLLDGGALFASGTDIGYDLDSDADQSDPESIFFNEFLKADYVSDDLDDYWIEGAPGSIFGDIPAFRLDDGNYGLYDADSPDVVSPIGDSEAAMTDDSGSSIVGVQYSASFQLIYFSFPFETIVDEGIRNRVMYCILNAVGFSPPPTPTPTHSPTATPTPTPSPTPWQIGFDFAADRDDWTTRCAPVVFSVPDFVFEPDYLKVVSSTNTNMFGYWQSLEDAIPADPDYLYRARFNVSTDITDQSLVPQIRLRVNSLNLQQYDVLSIESAGDGGASPTTTGTDYDLYFVPPENETASMIAFDLLNFNPDDAAVAELALDAVTVDRFALDSLSTPTTIQDYTFELSQDGWTTGGAPIFFTPPDYIHANGTLELPATTNTNTFGFWVNDSGDITIQANRLYHGTFEIRTDLTNQTQVPEIRLRFNTGNFQASRMLGITSAGDGANSPGTTNTTYDRLYFLPPTNCTGESLIVCFDIVNFSPDDIPDASLILDRAIIETLSPTTLP